MGRHSQGHGEGRQRQGNGGPMARFGPREKHRYGHLETRREKAERLANEATKRISELEHRVAVTQQAAQAAINLLKPYTTDRKPNMPLRRAFERTGKT